MVLRAIINNCLKKLFYGATFMFLLHASLLKRKGLLWEKIFNSRRMPSPCHRKSSCHRFAYLYPIKSPSQVRRYAEIFMSMGVRLAANATVVAPQAQNRVAFL